MSPYTQRIVAYFDIIGWKAACTDPSQYAPVSHVAQDLKAIADIHTEVSPRPIEGSGMMEVTRPMRRQIAAFSDNVAVSYPSEDVESLLLSTAGICRNLLKQGFLVRGGISMGGLFHHAGIIFGPALIEAVALEAEAKFPRILISRNVLDALQGKSRSDLVCADMLGRAVLNLLCLPDYLGRLSHDEKRRSEAIQALSPVIQAGLNKSAGNEANAEKWHYMQDAFKRMVGT